MIKKCLSIIIIFFTVIILNAQETIIEDFKVNTDNSNEYQDKCDIKLLSDGSFVICWLDERNEECGDIYYKVFNNDSSQRFDDRKVNDDTKGNDQDDPRVSVASDGNYVICWEDYRNSTVSIYFQCYNSEGYKIGNNKNVSSNSGDSKKRNPDICTFSNGNFIICWVDSRNGRNKDIYYQRFKEDGTLIGSKIRINDDSIGNSEKGSPHIVSNYDDSYLICWQDYRNGNYGDIYCQRFNADGSKDGYNFKVNEETSDNYIQTTPSIDNFSNGDFIICWTDYREGNADIYYQCFNTDGIRLGNNKIANDGPPFSESHQSYPDISISKDGYFIICWQDSRNGNYDIFAQKFKINAEKFETNFRIDNDETNSSQTEPNVVFGPENRLYFAWEDRRNQGKELDIYAKIIKFNPETPLKITIKSPSNGDTASIGKEKLICWENYNISYDYIIIQLSRDGGINWEELIKLDSPTGNAWIWDVKEPESNISKIKLTAFRGDESVFDISDGFFEIKDERFYNNNIVQTPLSGSQLYVIIPQDKEFEITCPISEKLNINELSFSFKLEFSTSLDRFKVEILHPNGSTETYENRNEFSFSEGNPDIGDWKIKIIAENVWNGGIYVSALLKSSQSSGFQAITIVGKQVFLGFFTGVCGREEYWCVGTDLIIGFIPLAGTTKDVIQLIVDGLLGIGMSAIAIIDNDENSKQEAKEYLKAAGFAGIGLGGFFIGAYFVDEVVKAKKYGYLVNRLMRESKVISYIGSIAKLPGVVKTLIENFDFMDISDFNLEHYLDKMNDLEIQMKQALEKGDYSTYSDLYEKQEAYKSMVHFLTRNTGLKPTNCGESFDGVGAILWAKFNKVPNPQSSLGYIEVPDLSTATFQKVEGYKIITEIDNILINEETGKYLIVQVKSVKPGIEISNNIEQIDKIKNAIEHSPHLSSFKDNYDIVGNIRVGSKWLIGVGKYSTTTELDTGIYYHKLNKSVPVIDEIFSNETKNRVTFRFHTDSEYDNKGWYIYRKALLDSIYVPLSGLLFGYENSNERHDYEYSDYTVKSDETYYYQIYQENIYHLITYISEPLFVDLKSIGFLRIPILISGDRIDSYNFPELFDLFLDSLFIEIPNNALTESTILQISFPKNIPVDKSPVFALDLSIENYEGDYKFENPVTIGFPYPDTVQEESKLTIMEWDKASQEWTPLELESTIKINDTSNIISAHLTHFSTYGIIKVVNSNLKDEESILTIPNAFKLSQNYPNPFNTETIIKYALPRSIHVSLKIYNILGQQVRTILDNKKNAGYHSIKWDGRNYNGIKVNSGVYVYRLSAGDFVQTKKMILLK